MPNKLKRFVFYWLPLILYCLFIYIQSANPSPEQIPSFPFVDKALHCVAYGIMGILFYRAYQTLRVRANIHMLMLLSVVSASLYGISDEIHQSFVPFRDAEVADVIADVIGAFSGVYLYQLLVVSRSDRKQRVLNPEGAIRPSAHRGLRLRPGGKAELKIRDKGY
jgi:VanZ family protein